MYLVPLRVEDAEVDRLPWVSICIAGVCALLFVVTYVVPRNPGGLTGDSLKPVMEYWGSRPYLALPDRLLEMLKPRVRELYGQLHRQALEEPPDEDEIEVEQKDLDGRVAALFREVDSSLLRRLSMVPARGFFQVGLITHMFLHLGWLHFLGNMLFFYIVGLLLEDRWGRGVFAGFYLAGGLLAAMAQYLMDPGSRGMLLGASGAVAACMGAFAVRFPMRQIRMGYLILWVWRGTFLVRAWAWGLIWFLLEVLSLRLDDGSSGVAFAAHVGGFGFGALFALGLRWTGMEERVLLPAMEKTTVAYAWHEGLDRAREAMETGDGASAHQELRAVLAQVPDSVDAEVMLVKLDAAGNQAEAVARAERLFSRLLLKGTADLFDTIEDLVKVLDPSLLKPTTLFRLGQSLDRAPEGLRPLAERLFAACAREPGPYAAKALVRAAQVRLDSGGETKGAREYLERFRAAPDVPADLKARASELEARIQELLDREKEISPRFAGKGIALESEPPPRQVQQPQDSPVAPSMPMRAAPDASAAPEAAQQVKAPEPSGSGLAQVMECSLGGMTRDALALVLEGGRQMDLSFTDMVAVAVGVVPEPAPPPAPPRNVLYTDLVIAWGGPGRPARVIRLRSSTLNLHSLYPGMPPADAYEVFLQHVLDQSGATALPDASALRRGEYPQYPDKESFIRAIHG